MTKPQIDAAVVPQALDAAREFINDVHFGEWAGPGYRRNNVQDLITDALAALQQAEPRAQAESCKLGCTESCAAKEHGCASECPALPWQPQAQAGEPVEWAYGANQFKDWCGHWFGPDSDDAYLAQAANELPLMANPLREAIAKKDEALKACVEALTYSVECINPEKFGAIVEIATDAINKAQASLA